VWKLRTAVAVGTDNHHDIAVGIAEPNFPVPGRGIDVRFQDNLGPQAVGSRHGRIKIIDFEPQQDTVSGWRRSRVDEVGMVFLVPGVQLKNHPTRTRDAIVHVSMVMFRKRVCSKQFSVPAAACPDIAHRYERLGPYGRFLRRDVHEARFLNSATGARTTIQPRWRDIATYDFSVIKGREMRRGDTLLPRADHTIICAGAME
jgi:hypothetical protein